MYAAAVAVIVATAVVAPVSRSGASSTRDKRERERRDDAVPRVIIDTDLSRWWDDATALGLANVLEEQGRVHVLGIMSDIRNPVAVAAIDAIDTAYGHGRTPVGAVADSEANTAPHGYSDLLAARLPHSVHDSDDVPAAVTLYRRLLAHQPDHSVTIVSLGAYTNLAGLLDSRHGRALVARKVKRLVIMDGVFPTGGPPFTNQKLDLAAASAVVGGAGWPTPVAWVDGLDGVGTQVGATLCATASAANPMRVVYEALFGCGPPRDGDWDAPALLYAVGDLPGVFTELGRGGAAVINAQGGLSWQTVSPRPSDVYVHVLDQQMLNRRIDGLLPLGAPVTSRHHPHARGS
ncbi:MAG TPA: nucleoside hydrolase [Acidimicrobiia bacterium]|jgi:hypothetical protein